MKNTQGVPGGRGKTAPESPPAGFPHDSLCTLLLMSLGGSLHADAGVRAGIVVEGDEAGYALQRIMVRLEAFLAVAPKGREHRKNALQNSAHAAPLREKTFPPCEKPSPTRSDTISSALRYHLQRPQIPSPAPSETISDTLKTALTSSLTHAYTTSHTPSTEHRRIKQELCEKTLRPLRLCERIISCFTQRGVFLSHAERQRTQRLT